MHFQAAGVAYGIQHYIDQNSKFLESCVYKTHGLSHLLMNYGAEVSLIASHLNSQLLLGSWSDSVSQSSQAFDSHLIVS